MELPAYLEARDRPRSGRSILTTQAVYAKAAENLEAHDRGRRPDPRRQALLLRLPAHLARPHADRARRVASLADYATNRIRKHELTTPVKEDDRVRQIEAVNAQTGPVMIGYPNAPEIDAMLAQAAAGKPDVDVTADDGVRHQLWVIADDATIGKLTTRLRCAAGDLHRRRPSPLGGGRARRRRPHGEGSHGYFLSVIFPQHEMTILDYNRVVKDLNGRSPETVSRRTAQKFHGRRRPMQPVRPASSHEFGMYLAGRWYRLTIRPELVPRTIRSAGCRSRC